MSPKILVTGALGQVGTDLTLALNKKYGSSTVIISGTQKKSTTLPNKFETLDVRDMKTLKKIIQKYKITQIYHLAGILSAKGEKDPQLAWDVNINGLKNVLDVAVKYNVIKVFWPSSIAAFGPTTPKNAPQHTIIEPTTMYGLTKLAGENLCHYYCTKYKLDIRSLRYPGLISYKAPPGGGTTDYAVAMPMAAIHAKPYTCFVSKTTTLPMMYMDDAIRATIQLMSAPTKNIKVRTSYNLAAMSFSAGALYKELTKLFPGFKCSFRPDFRQHIADSWPRKINDKDARKDWGWKERYNLQRTLQALIKGLQNGN